MYLVFFVLIFIIIFYFLRKQIILNNKSQLDKSQLEDKYLDTEKNFREFSNHFDQKLINLIKKES
jgi:beta-lactamase regulating signal transducer with metallopeptidase domain